MNNTIVRLNPLIKSLASRSAPIASRSFSNKIEDVCIHTGQVWDANDYRMVRFTNAEKHVNENWAMNLIAEVPPKEVTKNVVWCDGGDSHEGHPRVYINLDKPGNHTCGYCGLRFHKGH